MFLRKCFSQAQYLKQKLHAVLEFSERATEIHSLCKDEGLRVNEFKMSMVLDTRKYNFESQ